MKRKRKKIFESIVSMFLCMVLVLGNSNEIQMIFESEHIYAKEAKSEYIVVMKNHRAYDDVRENYKDYISNKNGEHKDNIDDGNIEMFNLSEYQVEELNKREDVISVEKNININVSGKTQGKSERQNSDKWNLKMINAENGEEERHSDEVVKIAIIDSGVDFIDQVEVKGRYNLVPGEDELSPIYEDATGHGTAIAGIIAASSSSNNHVKGINNNVELYSIKVFDETNQAPLSRIIDALYIAIEKDVDIINISWGTTEYSEALEIAIKAAIEKDILIVAATGNDGVEGKVQYPAAFENVISVGSIDAQGRVSEFSSSLGKVDVMAPGESIESTTFLDATIISSGTSLAVPHVVGMASLLWQKDTSKSADFISSLIVESANKTKGNIGIIDLEYANEIYDEFAEDYKDGTVEDNSDYQNNNILETFDDVESVGASWSKEDHEAYVQAVNGMKDKNGVVYTPEVLKYIKLGARINDECSLLKGNAKVVNGHQMWHALKDQPNNVVFNYIACALFLNWLILDDGLDIGDVAIPVGMSNYEFKTMRSELDDAKSEIKDAIGAIGEVSNKTRRYVYWGMIIHIITDAYAHRAFEETSDGWSHINENNTDNIDYKSARYTTAKKVVENILTNRVNINKPMESDLFQFVDFMLDSSYYNGTFKIQNFKEYIDECELVLTINVYNSTPVLKNSIKKNYKTSAQIDAIYGY